MSQDFIIRPVDDTRHDLEQLSRFCHELATYDGHTAHVTADKLRQGLFSGSRSVHAFLAMLQKEPIGFVLVYESFTVYHGERGLYMPGLYIAEAHRGQGYGGKLMRYIAAYALENRFGFLNWIVETGNSRANGFYDRYAASVSEGWSYCRLSGEALERAASRNT